MNYILFFILSFSSVSFVHANDCVDQLQKILMNRENARIVGFKDAYTCMEGKACAVSYELDNHPYPNSLMMAYMDLEKNFNLPWINKSSENLWMGYESSGQYFCADVKTYIRITDLQDESMKLNVTKRTAYDTMFCPAKKTFFDYNTSCTKI